MSELTDSELKAIRDWYDQNGYRAVGFGEASYFNPRTAIRVLLAHLNDLTAKLAQAEQERDVLSCSIKTLLGPSGVEPLDTDDGRVTQLDNWLAGLRATNTGKDQHIASPEAQLAAAQRENQRLRSAIDGPIRERLHSDIDEFQKVKEQLAAANQKADRLQQDLYRTEESSANQYGRAERLERELAAAREEVAQAQNWIRQNSEKWSGDWACATCKPYSDMIVKDFKCAVCKAREQLSAKERG